MEYKVGDRVRVRDLEWFERCCSRDIVSRQYEYTSDANVFVEEMVKYCGKVVTITNVYDNDYSIKEDGGKWFWQDWMFECKLEENSDEEVQGLLKEYEQALEECRKAEKVYFEAKYELYNIRHSLTEALVNKHFVNEEDFLKEGENLILLPNGNVLKCYYDIDKCKIISVEVLDIISL